MTSIGEKIRAARIKAGYKNAESLAVALGVGMRTVQRWEADTATPSIPRLLEIGKLTRQPLSYFIPDDVEAEAIA